MTMSNLLIFGMLMSLITHALYRVPLLGDISLNLPQHTGQSPDLATCSTTKPLRCNWQETDAAEHAQGRSQNSVERYEFSEPHMGTLFRLQLYALNETEAKKAAVAAFARIKQLNTILSDYQNDTELMKLCAKAGTGPVVVSPELFTVLQESQLWSARSGGKFDVSVGPLIQLWRRARRTRALPTDSAIKEAQALIGYQSLVLNATTVSVELKKARMRLDLGGIAKGYVADEVLKVLKANGISSACVAAGGDVVVSNRPPNSEGWVIGVSALDHNTKVPIKLLLENQAVSTAGDLEQYVEINGVRYSHIVDPMTGLGIVGRRSCTVVSARGIESDGADTSAYLLGVKLGIAMIDSQPGLACLFLEKDGDAVRQHPSQAWCNLRFKQ
jgi:thiamine biosynthesis lipoprotein